jgi:hypothetical protein
VPFTLISFGISPKAVMMRDIGASCGRRNNASLCFKQPAEEWKKEEGRGKSQLKLKESQMEITGQA